MNKKILIFSLLACTTAYAKTLAIHLPKIGVGKTIYLAADIEIPALHKINTAAGSNITVFEKVGKDWNQVANFDLNPAYASEAKFAYTNFAKVSDPNSELKITASLFHCPKVQKSGPCVIDDYEGVIKRSKSITSTEAKFSLKGTTY